MKLKLTAEAPETFNEESKSRNRNGQRDRVRPNGQLTQAPPSRRHMLRRHRPSSRNGHEDKTNASSILLDFENCM